MATKAFEIIARVKDLCAISGSTEDLNILRRLNDVQWQIYHAHPRWKALQSSGSLYTTELLTLNVAPSTAWAVGDTIRGVTSDVTCTIVEVLSTTTFNVKDRSGAFTLGEVLTNGTYTADQGLLYPTVSSNAYVTVPSTLEHLYTLRQVSTSPYTKLTYVPVQKFHNLIPQPTEHAEEAPLYYTWWGSKFYLFPIPDQTYTLEWYGYLKPTRAKIYVTGTAAVSTVTVTGTSTHFDDNTNVEVGMYYASQADIIGDGSYPWGLVKTVTDGTHLVLNSSYTGATTADGTYVCSNLVSYPEEFDQLLITMTALLTSGRNREEDKFLGFLYDQQKALTASLIQSQNFRPDYRPIMEDYSPSGMTGLPGEPWKYPFIMRS